MITIQAITSGLQKINQNISMISLFFFVLFALSIHGWQWSWNRMFRAEKEIEKLNNYVHGLECALKDLKNEQCYIKG